MPHTRSEPRLEERHWYADVRRRERECDKRDNLLARRQETIQHINGEAVQLALLSADTAAQAAVLSKRQVDKAFTEPQAKIVGEVIESALPPVCTLRPPAHPLCKHLTTRLSLLARSGTSTPSTPSSRGHLADRRERIAHEGTLHQEHCDGAPQPLSSPPPPLSYPLLSPAPLLSSPPQPLSSPIPCSLPCAQAGQNMRVPAGMMARRADAIDKEAKELLTTVVSTLREEKLMPPAQKRVLPEEGAPKVPCMPFKIPRRAVPAMPTASAASAAAVGVPLPSPVSDEQRVSLPRPPSEL